MLNRQRYSMYIGLLILFAHLGISAYFLFVFAPPSAEVNIEEISFPLTVAYVSSIVMWFFANRGIVTNDDPIGWPLAVVILAIVLAMVGALFAVPLQFSADETITVAQLNQRYLFVELAFGGIFGIVMAELFGHQRGGSSA
jgi:hypothetical protein